MATIDELRTHLFATLEALNDKENPMDIERAKAVAEVAQVIINSAKVEVDHLKVTGGKGTGFIADNKDLPRGITGVTQHKIAG
ncbi:hypothetical protein [Paraburkholderia rhynchosiae]|uniref:Uncharacterized protein n=1 Tax=Paraburkholderia rhynchosiae TaxID=487049 RepID=A0A2N7W968_9BURK|nr:hypothetical protein [Paraburkholderia rhynchosiae]PMS25951.1 hypothetical protein C0Z16_27840 [Paraburkholderia rhynchosiae]CAB3730387.1 hypothetical protein LMG27174_05739 [Paraburkholderia rhynchosiae]